MPLSLKGYVLEPPRVGSANSPFTLTPNDAVADQGAFDAYYPQGSEPVSRADYAVLVQTEGALAGEATFGYTKNASGVQRFDYDAFTGSFRPLPGSAPDAVGTLTVNANSARLKVRPPSGFLAEAPFRLFVGEGSGHTFAVSLVPTDGAFGSPAAGVVELSQATGNINWSPGDLTTYEGQPVRFQRQSFYPLSEKAGPVGIATADGLLLSPLPATGQYPIIRLGFGLPLLPIEVASEGSFSSNPAAGTVEWAVTTGKLKFHAADAASGKPVYYDGVLLAWKRPLPSHPVGSVVSPLPLSPPPSSGGDLIFRLISGYQFPLVRRVAAFDAGVAGEVQVRDDGAVRFSDADQATYGASTVTVYVGDLPIEHGIVLRLFRSPVNLDGSDPAVKDVTQLYAVTGAVWASPLAQVPYILLPATPVEDPTYPLRVYVEQGTGSYTGDLPDLGGLTPPAGLGYVLDYDTRQLRGADRKVNQSVTLAEAGASVQLPDFPVKPENLTLELETGPGTGTFSPLTIGTTALFDPGTGQVTLTSQTGQLRARGEGAALAGSTLTDSLANFVDAGVTPGDLVLVQTGPASGVYTVLVVTPTLLGLDLSVPASDPSAAYEVRSAGEVLADRYFAPLTPVDPNTKVERVRSLGAGINAQVIVPGPGSATFPTTSTLTDTGEDFVAAGVAPGDTLIVTSGPDAGAARLITAVETNTLTVARAFTDFSGVPYRVERRLRLPVDSLTRSRVRAGQTFSDLVLVARDADFSSPASNVEASEETGNLNLPPALLGVAVAWGLTLRLQLDFRISKDLGFFDLTERLLTADEIYVTYKPVTSAGVQPPVTEHVGFLIRKELTQPTPRAGVTSQVTFNAAGRTVAAVPAPAVYRGGRPQDATQVVISPPTITFQPNVGFMTDALPSGSALQPDERVLVDYYVYEAVGGEKAFTVLQPPVFAAQVLLSMGAGSFVLVGDQTAVFPANYLLRVDQQQVYLLDGATYDASTDTTTVHLAYGATFQDDFVNPSLFLSSGPIPFTSAPFQPAYLTTEIHSFLPVPRGMNRLTFAGDVTLSYPKGTVLLFTDGVGLFDLYLVSGASVSAGQTNILLQQNTRRQYLPGQVTIKRSVRPILEDGVTQVESKGVPLLTQGVTLYRRVEGQPGVELASPSDYKVDASGTVRFAVPLGPKEALILLSTSYRMVPAGTAVRASYTAYLVPSEQNGLLGQIVKADYTLASPDSFYFRVETLSNFSAEVLQALQASAQSSSPSGGPITSNASTPKLFEQGSASLFFTEGHTANVDYVSRQYLLFFNDVINHLEDVLQDEDGRVIGDVDGRFRFDALLSNPVRTSYDQVTNEIDDRFRVSDFPAVVTYPPFPVTITYLGTNLPLYKASTFSRLFPTVKDHLTAFTVAGDDTSASTGDAIGDFGQPSLTSVPSTVYRKLPRAQLTVAASAGSTVLFVNAAHGDPTFLLPPFAAGMTLVAKDRDGTDLITDATPVTVSGVLSSPERLQVDPLPADLPLGSTVFLCTTGSSADTSYAKTYRVGFDVNVDTDQGYLTFQKAYPPFDGSVPLVPAQLCVQAPNSGEFLAMDGAGIMQVSQTAFKFPALYGGLASDCGDQSIPILSPSLTQEILANAQETALTAAVLADVTMPVVVPNIALDGTATILTALLPFPSPAPRVGDLVRFVTGPNAGNTYHRIIAVIGFQQVQVDVPFTFVAGSYSAVFTATADVATGVAGTFPTATEFQLPAPNAAIHVGHTLIFTSGLNTNVRRNVVARLSSTLLQLDHAVPNPASAANFRVSNHLNTYSGFYPVAAAAQVQETVLRNGVAGPGTIDSVVRAIDFIFDRAFTDLLSPTLESADLLGSTLTDLASDFVARGVNPTDFVYIDTGMSAGAYPIVSVDSPTQLTVGVPFPVNLIFQSYRVVRVYGLGSQALQDLAKIRDNAYQWATDASIWAAHITFPGQVVVPPGVMDTNIEANLIGPTDVALHLSQLADRAALITNPTDSPIAKVTAILNTRDKLYDTRYAWIDARVNVQKGSLYVIERAVAARQAAEVQLTQDLLKILSVKGVGG